jgi:HEAT repeat protein
MAVGLAEVLTVTSLVATQVVRGADAPAWTKFLLGEGVKWLDRQFSGRLAQKKRAKKMAGAARTAATWVTQQPPSAARDLLAHATPERWPEVASAIAALGSDLDGARLQAAVDRALRLSAPTATTAAREDAAALFMDALLMVLDRSGELGPVAADLQEAARIGRLTAQLDDVLERLDPTRLPFTVGTLLAACHAQVEATLGALDGRYRSELYVRRGIEGAVEAALAHPDSRRVGAVLVASPGTGKTNLLCHLARVRVRRQPVVLLRAGTLDGGAEALHRAIAFALARSHTGVRITENADSMRALREAGRRIGRPALILVDGLEDHPDLDDLRRGLRALVEDARRGGVRVLLAARPAAWAALKDRELSAAFATLPQAGDTGLGPFDDRELRDALDRYLDAYEVEGNLAHGAAERCRHPTLLRLFCEVYQGQEVGPALSLRLGALFDRYWERTLADVASRPWDGENPGTRTQRLARLEDVLMALATWLLDHEARAVPVPHLPAVHPHATAPGNPESALGLLVGAGVLAIEDPPGPARPPEVRFVFEELGRYALGRALARRWRAAALDEPRVLAEIEAHIATAGDTKRIAAALVHAGTRLWARDRIRVWPALLDQPGVWRRAGFAVLTQIDPHTLGEHLDEALITHLIAAPASCIPALDALKTPELAQAASPDVRARAGHLLTHKDHRVRRRAALVQRFAPAAEAAPLLAAALKDRRREVRKNAGTALMELGAAGVAALLSDLATEDADARECSALALGTLANHPDHHRLWPGLDEAIVPLVGALADPVAAVRARAAGALGHWLTAIGGDAHAPGPATVDSVLRPALETGLLGALVDPVSRVRRQAAIALGALGSTTAATALDAALTDRDPTVATAVVHALGHMPTPAVLARLATALSEAESPATRAAAAEALSATASGQTALLAALADDDSAVRAAAASSLAVHAERLGALPPAEAEPILRTLLQGGPAERLAAARALSAGGAEDPDGAILAVLQSELARRAVATRVLACQALGYMKSDAARHSLEAALVSPSRQVRAAALQGLGAIGDALSRPAIQTAAAAGRVPPDIAVEVLSRLVGQAQAALPVMDLDDLSQQARDVDPDQRAAAITALGRSALPEAIAAVDAALGDRSLRVRMAAVGARAAQGGPQVVAALSPRLRDARTGVRRQAAEALGRLRIHPPPPAALRALQQALSDKNGRVRAAAARSLAALRATSTDADLRRLLHDPDPEVQDAVRSARRTLARHVDVDPEATTTPGPAR